MSISDYVWGVSRAQDRVWAQVSGMSPSKAGRRLFMVLQAYIDDSSGTDGTFVLGGYIASAEEWAAFVAEWDQLLPLAQRGKDGQRRFKMAEMNQFFNRPNLPNFYSVIEDHVRVAVSATFNKEDLKRARARLSSPDVTINWGYS